MEPRVWPEEETGSAILWNRDRRKELGKQKMEDDDANELRLHPVFLL